ncbi:MAG: IPT/TIG domain-containing protein [Planctomycetota bacterium]
MKAEAKAGPHAARRLGRRFLHLGAVAATLSVAACLVGFIRIGFSPGSPSFKWASPVVTYVINSKGSDDIPDLSEAAAIRLAFRSWEQVTDSTVRFQEDATADASRTDFVANDLHLVIFDETGTSGYFPAGSNIIALTPITAATADGTILDADILFNGKLSFTTNPGQDTSRFDVQAVITHEVGHFIGLDHSGGPQATMFTQIPGGTIYARSLGEDDRAAAATIYPSGAGLRARLQGTLSLTGGGGLGYAQVVAVANPSGEYTASALSDSAGGYVLEGLPAGKYDIYVEPVNGPFQLVDTIAYKSQSSTSFKTTWAPTNPVTLSAGQTAGLSFSAPPSPTLNVSSASGGRIRLGTSAQLVLGGAGMDKVTAVRVTGTGVTVESFNSSTPSLLTVTLTASADAAPTIRCLELTGPGGEVCLLSAAIDVTSAPPGITKVTPTQLSSTGGQSLTIDGVNFESGSSVVIGGQLAQSVVVSGSTQLSCISPGSPGVTTPVDLVVIRPDGQEARLTGAVTYEAAPVVQSVDPASGPLVGGTKHTVRGSGFGSPATVTFGDATAEVLSVAADSIQVVLPASTSAKKVTVSVSAGGKTGALIDGFTYVDGTAPKVDSLAPNSGPTAGGSTITIVGSGFDPNATTTFGGVLAQRLSVTPTQLVVSTPAHAAGAVEVRVQNPNGLATVAGTYTYSDSVVTVAPASKKKSDCSLGGPEAPGGSAPLGPSALLGLLLWARLRRRA